MCPVLYHEITARDVALLNRNASKAACERDTLELIFYHFHQFIHLYICGSTIKFALKHAQKYDEICTAVSVVDLLFSLGSLPPAAKVLTAFLNF